MTYEEATHLLSNYIYLDGTQFKGQDITLVIVPTDKGGLMEIIDGILRMKSLDGIRSNYEDFDVVALLDFDDFHLTGKMQWEYLSKIITSK